jgi:hypothetical protein
LRREVDGGESRRALTTAPPCLPVAPVMRIVWGEDMMDGYIV